MGRKLSADDRIVMEQRMGTCTCTAKQIWLEEDGSTRVAATHTTTRTDDADL